MTTRLSFLIVVATLILGAVAILKWNTEDLVLYQHPAPEKGIENPALRISAPAEDLSQSQANIHRLNVSEELILKLTPELKQISKFLEGSSRRLPNVFSRECQIKGPVEKGIVLQPPFESDQTSAIFEKIQWPVGNYRPLNETFWSAVLAQARFQDSKFGVISGQLLPAGNTFRMTTSFESRLEILNAPNSPAAAGVKATQTIDFQRTGLEQWKIVRWEQVNFQIQLAGHSLFCDVTESAIPQSSALATIKRSEIVELLKQELHGEDFPLKHDKISQLFHDWHSSAQYNSVSVVDFDGDDWDDLFLTNNLGETLLLRNRQDGTFEDVSAECGLQLARAYTNCALFADFDNDGDKDVLLGRNFQQCLYFQNEDGKFSLDDETNTELQDCKLVSAGSVIDINNDGLLDVYLSTYNQTLGASQEWINYAVPERQAEMLRQQSMFRHSYLDRAGPPNIVLMNVNGKLKRLEPQSPLAQWRNSFQSVWLDYDSDGDQDVYLCNDFAPDVLLENQTERQSQHPLFKDATEEVFGKSLMGFGMGASVGDYDNNGLLDVYVSNMYSKAGNRIFDHLDRNVHPALQIAAAGNFLYRNTGDARFTQVAGTSKENQHVANVGWSYGGQFADFNNDGQLDVYVPSGLFTPPDDVAADLDL